MTARRLAAALLVATAALFAIGVAAEGGDDHDEATEHTEASEAGEHDEATDAHEGEATETRLGIDLERPGPVGAAVVLSLALAVGLLIRRRRWIALAAAIFALAFTVLDLAEIGHQLDEHRTGIAVLAAAVAAGHLATAGLAGAAVRPRAAEETR